MTTEAPRLVESERFRRIADLIVNTLCLGVAIIVVVLRVQGIGVVEEKDPVATSTSSAIDVIDVRIHGYFGENHALPEQLDEISLSSIDQWRYERTGPRSYRLVSTSENRVVQLVVREENRHAR